jgi:hypothetical protein
MCSKAESFLYVLLEYPVCYMIQFLFILKTADKNIHEVL